MKITEDTSPAGWYPLVLCAEHLLVCFFCRFFWIALFCFFLPCTSQVVFYSKLLLPAMRSSELVSLSKEAQWHRTHLLLLAALHPSCSTSTNPFPSLMSAFITSGSKKGAQCCTLVKLSFILQSNYDRYVEADSLIFFPLSSIFFFYFRPCSRSSHWWGNESCVIMLRGRKWAAGMNGG